MIDIINFKADKIQGFSKVYNLNDLKIKIGSDDKTNRKIVENKQVDIFLSPEKTRTKDFMHYRDSGLNQVLCKLAKKNNIAIGFNFNEVLNSKNKPLLLGKMMQNVRLCRKYNVKMIIISGAKNHYELRYSQELASFGMCLGMNPGEAKKALNFSKEQC